MVLRKKKRGSRETQETIHSDQSIFAILRYREKIGAVGRCSRFYLLHRGENRGDRITLCMTIRFRFDASF